jgi:hypothetical protein
MKLAVVALWLKPQRVVTGRAAVFVTFTIH